MWRWLVSSRWQVLDGHFGAKGDTHSALQAWIGLPTGQSATE